MSSNGKKTVKQRLGSEASEVKDAAKEVYHYTRKKNWLKSIKDSVVNYPWWWVGGLVLIAIAIVLSIEKNKIVAAFDPHKQDIVNFPASWVFPIIILIIVSFPPLFGHEIILLVVGLIWGVWIGFGIACAGTFIGEMACFFVFKYLWTEKAKKVEDESVMYACLAKLMREGGVGQVILVRLSAVPGHIVTAMQSTVGMPVWIYAVAIIVSLPKQLAIVYLGQLFGENSANDPSTAAKERAASISVLVVTVLITIVAMHLVYMRARRLYPEVKIEYDKRHQTGQEFADTGSRGTEDDLEMASRHSYPTSNLNPEAGKSFETISEVHAGGGGGGGGAGSGSLAQPEYVYYNESEAELLAEQKRNRNFNSSTGEIPYQLPPTRNPFEEDVGYYPRQNDSGAPRR